jgi:2-dehydro-3-deoxygluconokinase
MSNRFRGRPISISTRTETILKLTADGTLTTLAGQTGDDGWADGAGSDAAFRSPSGVALDPAGNVFAADWANGAIRRITPGGWVTTPPWSAPRTAWGVRPVLPTRRIADLQSAWRAMARRLGQHRGEDQIRWRRQLWTGHARPRSGKMSPMTIETTTDPVLPVLAAARLDALALGALVHRLDPGVVPLHRAQSFDVHVSGGEFNPIHALAECFGLKTAIATAMPHYPIGDLVRWRVRAAGVEGIYKEMDHDSVRGPNIATVYSDRGHGVRPPVVFYNRSNEAAALLKPGDFDWATIFRDGVRWVHSGGIFASLSTTTSQVILEMLDAAGPAGALRSVDLNYRAKLWAPLGGAAQAQKTMRAIASKVDVLIGNEEDMQTALGIKGPDVHGTRSGLEVGSFFEMIERVVEQFPNIRAVATTLRQVHSANRHSWSAVLWIKGHRFQAPTCELDVLDRIGGGDGFAAGLIYGLLKGQAPEQALRLGWAHGAMLTTFPGDTTMATLAQVEAFAKGGGARVQR